jgi:pimeloyl-ACP methyl ester carboxylesterase
MGKSYTSAYLTINGLNLHYTVAGEGAPALLVHGHASSQALWPRVHLRDVDSIYCRYTLDLPGHGASDKPPLNWFTLENYTQLLYEFCRQLGLKNVLLAGHSMGGLLCLNLALTHPELAKQLLLIAPVVEGSFLAYLDPLLHLESFAFQFWAEQMLRIYNIYPWLAAPIGANWYARPSMIFSDSFKQTHTDFARCPMPTLFGNFKMVRHADLRNQLPHLRSPMLIITGDRDRVVPPQQAQMIAERAPRAKLVTISHCGHLPFDEQPALFAAAVKEYFQMII